MKRSNSFAKENVKFTSLCFHTYGFGIIALAHPLILLFGGKEFLPAVPVMQILSTLLVIITLSGF